MATQEPLTMQAIIVNGNDAKITEIALPKMRPTYVRVKVHSVALNPADHMNISDHLAAPNSILGCDFSGTVVEVGSEVTKNLKPGDRVAGVAHGANFSEPEDGCFSEYTVAKGDLLVKLPDSLSFEDASSFPLGVSTVGQGLFQKAVRLQLPSATTPRSPDTDHGTVLIYGGSTATGALGIQFAKLAGYRVLATCSPRHNDTVRALGADAVYDYRDSEVGKRINADTHDSLKYVWDTVSIESSAVIAAQALSSNGNGARYGSLLPVKFPREDVEAGISIMFTIFGEGFSKFGNEFPASKEDFDFAKKFFGLTEDFLAEGKLRPHVVRVGSKGLEGVLQGLRDLKEGKVSGEKLVYRVEETPEGSKAELTL